RGVFLAFALQRLFRDIDLAFQEVPDVIQLFPELVALYLVGIASKHAICEAIKAPGHFQGVEDGQPGRELELAQLQHGWPAIEANAGPFVVDASAMAAGAGEADLVGFSAAGYRIDDTRHARKAYWQSVDIVCGPWLQASHRVRRRLGLGIGVHKAKAAQVGRIAVHGFGAGNESESFKIGAVREQAGATEQPQARLLQRNVPGVRYREGRSALARMVKPEPVFGRPVLVKPISRFHRAA